MEFKNIQRNHPVYLLDKQTVEVKEGKVVDNQPHINTGIATISSSGQPMRDVTIEVEGKQTIYTNEPSAILAQKSKYCCALVSFSGTSLLMRKEMKGVL